MIALAILLITIGVAFWLYNETKAKKETSPEIERFREQRGKKLEGIQINKELERCWKLLGEEVRGL